MAREFDPGYGAEPFRTLVADAPGAEVYPQSDFRIEWGPVFHRGRLDGSARVLVLGQDPAQHETILRRILVGEAGHRTQGFLAKLGIDTSYVMVNTFLYSVFGQSGGNKHRNSVEIAAYRNRWLRALLSGTKVEAVVALGTLADSAWQTFVASADSAGVQVKYAPITHPTEPEAAGGDAATHAAAIRRLLGNWNKALQALHPLQQPDRVAPLALYGDAFKAGEKVAIPDADTPAWAPEWMRLNDGWADRPGRGITKRASILIRVPPAYLP
jgi:uracil DNA glycosylase superfamily protein